MDDTDIETHFADLESRIAFQEDAIEALNQVIINQQKDIDRLERQVQRLEHMMSQGNEGVTGDPSKEPPPPHY